MIVSSLLGFCLGFSREKVLMALGNPQGSKVEQAYAGRCLPLYSYAIQSSRALTGSALKL
jgi:hypothetical protein